MEGRSFFPSFFVSQPPPLARPPSSPLVRERAASAATWCERSARGLTTTKSRISRRERGESLFALLRSRPPRRLGPRPPFLSSSRPQSPLFSISLDFFLFFCIVDRWGVEGGGAFSHSLSRNLSLSLFLSLFFSFSLGRSLFLLKLSPRPFRIKSLWRESLHPSLPLFLLYHCAFVRVTLRENRLGKGRGRKNLKKRLTAKKQKQKKNQLEHSKSSITSTTTGKVSLARSPLALSPPLSPAFCLSRRAGSKKKGKRASLKGENDAATVESILVSSALLRVFSCGRKTKKAKRRWTRNAKGRLLAPS